MIVDALVRPNIRALTPYRSARQDHLRGILLDANENAFGSVLAEDGTPLHRYPDPFQVELRQRLAALHGVSLDEVFAGVGSDEVIDLLFRVFCEPGRDRVLLLEPTYGMYRVAASIQGALVDSALLTGSFQLDREAVASAIRPETKLIFCCSPNNPTGNLLRTEDILWMCHRAPGLVVVDEAYADFAGGASLALLLAEQPNLVILRTLSKAWGLAALRLGYALAMPAVVRYLLKVKPPYNIGALTAKVALEALERSERKEETVAQIRRERARLAAALRSCSCVRTVFPSDANFLLVRFSDARAAFTALLTGGVVVRDRSFEPKLDGCLRITIGTPNENDAVLAILRTQQ